MDEYDSDGSVSDFEDDFGLGHTGVKLKGFGKENIDKSRETNLKMMDKAQRVFDAAVEKFKVENERLALLKVKQEEQEKSDSKKEKLTDKVKKRVQKVKDGVGSVVKDIKQGSNASDEDVAKMIANFNKFTKAQKGRLKNLKHQLFGGLAKKNDIEVNSMANEYITVFNSMLDGQRIIVKPERARNLVLRFLSEREKVQDNSRRGSQSSVDGSDDNDTFYE